MRKTLKPFDSAWCGITAPQMLVMIVALTCRVSGSSYCPCPGRTVLSSGKLNIFQSWRKKLVLWFCASSKGLVVMSQDGSPSILPLSSMDRTEASCSPKRAKPSSHVSFLQILHLWDILSFSHSLKKKKKAPGYTGITRCYCLKK